MGFKVTVLIFLVVCLLFYNNASNVKFTNFVCRSFNESWTIIHECRLRAISRNKTILNFNCTVLHPIQSIRVRLQVFKKENGYKPWLYKFELDGCKFLEKAYNPVAIILYKTFRRYSNFNHTCPFVGPQYIKGYHVPYEFLRVPVPSGDFLLDVEYFYDNTLQISTKVYVRIDDST